MERGRTFIRNLGGGSPAGRQNHRRQPLRLDVEALEGRLLLSAGARHPAPHHAPAAGGHSHLVHAVHRTASPQAHHHVKKTAVGRRGKKLDQQSSGGTPSSGSGSTLSLTTNSSAAAPANPGATNPPLSPAQPFTINNGFAPLGGGAGPSVTDVSVTSHDPAGTVRAVPSDSGTVAGGTIVVEAITASQAGQNLSGAGRIAPSASVLEVYDAERNTTAVIPRPVAAGTTVAVDPVRKLVVFESPRTGRGSVQANVLEIYDVARHHLIDTDLPLSDADYILRNGKVVFRMSEAAVRNGAHTGVDLNHNGTTSDDVLVLYDLDTNTLVSSGQQALPDYQFDGQYVVFHTSEAAQSGAPADPSQPDRAVLQVWDLPHQNRVLNTGSTDMGDVQLQGDLVAFRAPKTELAIPESSIATSPVLRVYDIANQKLIDPGMAAEPGFVIDPSNRTVAFASPEAEAAQDFNGDGQLHGDGLLVLRADDGTVINAHAGVVPGQIQAADGLVAFLAPLEPAPGSGLPATDDPAQNVLMVLRVKDDLVKDSGETVAIDPQTQAGQFVLSDGVVAFAANPSTGAGGGAGTAGVLKTFDPARQNLAAGETGVKDTAQPVSGGIGVEHGLVTFLSPGGGQGWTARDGVPPDQVLQVYDLAQDKVINTKLRALDHYQVDPATGQIAFLSTGPRVGQNLKGPHPADAPVLVVFDPATQRVAISNRAVDNGQFSFSGGVAAMAVSERLQGLDLNANGRVVDTVLELYKPDTGLIINSGQVAGPMAKITAGDTEPVAFKV